MSWEEFPVKLLVDNPPRIFHTTGITLGIGESTAQTALRAVELAKSLGIRISFDVNYRSKLWSQTAACEGIQAIAELADILLLPHRDAVGLYHCAGQDPNADLAALHRRFPKAIIVMTLGAKGACLQCPSGIQYSAPAFPAAEVERLGTGDAFTAGFLYGLLTTDSLSSALRWGNATAAFKYSIPSEFALVAREEVAALVDGTASGPFIR
jgi:2-dehydro-3-deoxygluconokinase